MMVFLATAASILFVGAATLKIVTDVFNIGAALTSGMDTSAKEVRENCNRTTFRKAYAAR